MRVGKERLAVEALKLREELEEEHARVAQDSRCRLDIATLAAEHDLVRRRVVLHLFAGAKAILTRRFLFDLSDAVTAAESRQRRVGQFGSFRNQFFMDSDQVAVAGGIEFQISAAGAVGRVPNAGWKGLRMSSTGLLSGQPDGRSSVLWQSAGSSSPGRAIRVLSFADSCSA